MWVEFFVASCPYSKGFSPSSLVFFPPQKPTFPNSNLTWKQSMKKQFCGSHSNSHLYLFYLNYVFLFVYFVKIYWPKGHSHFQENNNTVAITGNNLSDIIALQPSPFISSYSQFISELFSTSFSRSYPFPFFPTLAVFCQTVTHPIIFL